MGSEKMADMNLDSRAVLSRILRHILGQQTLVHVQLLQGRLTTPSDSPLSH